MKKSGVGSGVACENSGSFGCHEEDVDTRILIVERGRSNCEYSVLAVFRGLAATETQIGFVLICADGRSDSDRDGGSLISVIDAGDYFCQKRIA